MGLFNHENLQVSCYKDKKTCRFIKGFRKLICSISEIKRTFKGRLNKIYTNRRAKVSYNELTNKIHTNCRAKVSFFKGLLLTSLPDSNNKNEVTRPPFKEVGRPIHTLRQLQTYIKSVCTKSPSPRQIYLIASFST